MSELCVRAPATIANVGPGFDIYALALEGPVDRFRISLTSSPGEIRIRFRGGEGDIPVAPEKNTAGLAASHILERLDASAGAEIEIVKGMPSCAGLGSSAASAAACAFGLDQLLGKKMSRPEILEAARLGEIASGGTPHADNVAACLLGGFAFIRNLDPLDVVTIPVPEMPVVIRVMRKARTTTRGLIPDRFSLADLKKQMALCADVMYALSTGDVEAFGRAVNTDLVSEPTRSRDIPGYEDIKRDVLTAGAFGCNISGGGSSVFAICPEDRVEDIAALMAAPAEKGETPPLVLVTRTSNRGIEVIDGL